MYAQKQRYPVNGEKLDVFVNESNQSRDRKRLCFRQGGLLDEFFIFLVPLWWSVTIDSIFVRFKRQIGAFGKSH